MAAGRAERFRERRTRLVATFGDDEKAVRTASRDLELMEQAWRDSYGGDGPPEEIVDDVLVCSSGTLPGLIDAAHLAVTDWHDVKVWASELRDEGARPGGARLHP